MSAATWKDKLHGRMPEFLEQEVDVYETELELKRQNKIDDKMFAETRLRRGAYGQRYDNGQRHDGAQTRDLTFPQQGLTKGPDTMWDAPGMQRIKIPFGKMSAEQLDVLSELAEEYSDNILHVTTRQDIQLHFIHIEDTPDLMRRLASVGITTREACGNSVRNVTACPYAGTCSTETFDVTPYADATVWYLMGHPDTGDFGRKFKIAFSGCKSEPCGLTNFHDLGAIAKTWEENGQTKRGFELYVGGGLGAVPMDAKLLDEAVPEEELLPMSQAISRVFARLGEKQNRARARIKFLVKKLGIDEFRRLVLEEREGLKDDPRWTDYLQDLHKLDEKPLREGGDIPAGPYPEGFERWRATNLRPQAQAGYYVATVTLPLGDATGEQGRRLADIARKYTGDTMRTTVEQNIAYRWLSGADVVDFYRDLQAIGLHEAGASTITDMVACPGTDTCKLGISASRGLAGEVRRRLKVVDDKLDPAVQQLRVKASGCFNACGQHHVADLGFLGVSRNVRGRRVPHFQVVLGGEWANNGGSYGLAIGAVPSKNIPAVIERLTDRFVAEREGEETFQAFIKRIGKAEIRNSIDDLTKVPSYDEDPSYYSDWGDPREYTIGDMGVGECAGEIVPFVEFGLKAAERLVFEAQIDLDAGNVDGAARKAYDAMTTAAQALVRHLEVQISDEPDDIVREFRARFYDTKLFHDKYAGGKFAHYLFRAHDEKTYEGADADTAHSNIDEAQLFIEAAYACYERLTQQPQAAVQAGAQRPAAPPAE
ncbi:MAG: nitrite/sulfite reductase [Myxococcota bacterium]